MTDVDTHKKVTLEKSFNDKVFVKKDMRLVCNCLEVNKFHGCFVPQHKIGQECATLKNKIGACIFCGYDAFYYDINIDGKLGKEKYDEQVKKLVYADDSQVTE